MKRYFYKAKDSFGKLVSGEVEALSETEAARLVRKKGLTVFYLKLNKGSFLGFSLREKKNVSTAEKTAFTRQLATMINAGLSIIDSLLILRSQTTGVMQKVTAKVLADVEGGVSLSSAFAKHPSIFSPTYIALVKSGEAGGVMDKVLNRLADNLEKEQEFSGKVKGALIYPAVVIGGMVVVGLVLMIFVIPRLISLYNEFGAKLPGPTRVLIGISSILTRYWPVFLVILLVSGYFLISFRKTKAGKKKFDELLFKIPIVGPLQRQVILAELSRTLSLMVGSGVSILDGLNITADVVGNSVVSDALKDVASQVEKGFPLTFAFSRHPEAFPFILSQMVAVGEETGKMEDVLSKVSHVFEVESDQKVKSLTSAIEPLVMVLLGIGVGFLVIAVVLPIYNLTSQF
jgi:type IV pilus assembly protein PilC